MLKIFKIKNAQIAFQFSKKREFQQLLDSFTVVNDQSKSDKKYLIEVMTQYLHLNDNQLEINEIFYKELNKFKFDEAEENLLKLQFLKSTNKLSDEQLFEIINNHNQENNLQYLINLAFYLSQSTTIYKEAQHFYKKLLQILNDQKDFDIHNFTYSIHSLYLIAKNQDIEIEELRNFCKTWEINLIQNLESINPKFLPVFLDLLDQNQIMQLIKKQIYNYEPQEIENLLYCLQNIESQELWIELQELIINNIDSYSVQELCQILVYYYKSGNANQNLFLSIEVSLGQRHKELQNDIIPVIGEIMIQSGFYRQKFFALIQDQAAKAIENYTIDECISLAYCFSRTYTLKKNSQFFLLLQKKLNQVELSDNQLGKLSFSLVMSELEFFYSLQKSIPEDPLDFISVYFYQDQPKQLKIHLNIK